MAYFSNPDGVLSIPLDSVSRHKGFIFSAPGFNLKYVPTDSLGDTSTVYLKGFINSALSEEMRLAGFEKMKPIFLRDFSKLAKRNSGVLQKRRMILNEVPIEVKGVSGRVVPSIKDSGLVLSSLRWSNINFEDVNLFQENVLSSLDSGLFRKMQDLSALDFVLLVGDKTFDLNPLSNLNYPSPIHEDNSLLYQYYLIDSVEIDGSVIYRIKIEPREKLSALFSGNIWIDSKKANIIEMGLKVYQENHINFADSLDIHFYFNQNKLNQDGNAQNARAWINILGYKFTLNVSSLLLKDKVDDFGFDKTYRVVESDSIDNTDTLKYFNGFINGNRSVLDGLDQTHSIQSKDYKLTEIFNSPRDFASAFFLTGATYKFGKGYFEMVPFFLTNGFNTVEGWYINYRGSYHLDSRDSRLKITPYLRYGFASKTWLPRAEVEYEFNFINPIKILLEGGAKMQQFNPLDPINPGINMLYSIGLGINYMKIYRKNYLKFKFDKELMKGLELVFSFEVAKREAVFNNTSFALFGLGDSYTPNNPERPPAIDSSGFDPHMSNTMEIQLYYQFGRRYDYINKKLVKINSNLPRISLVYKKGFGYRDGMPSYNFLRLGVGNKTRIRDVGLFEADIVIGGFIDVEHIEFADYQHFSGVQTAFINYTYDGWTDVRQFSTLPYYDYSTRESFVEIHLKHRFLGWLLSKPKFIKKYTLQSYVGYNFLMTSELGAYNEVYFGFENILRVINIQFAAGIDRNSKIHSTILLGVSFDYNYYLNSKKRN